MEKHTAVLRAMKVRYLTVQEACCRLRLGKTKVYSLIQEGRLESFKFGRATRISLASIRHYERGSSRAGVE